ncbi:MAG: PqqD family protein [Prevotellamassilia sp.]|nr:PqqD family protein [Prevotellamassilia sp.]
MKIKQGFELRDICGEKVILATGIENVDFNQMISLNETAAYLWQNIGENEFDAQRLADLLCDAYEVSPKTALADAQSVIKQWTNCGIIE